MRALLRPAPLRRAPRLCLRAATDTAVVAVEGHALSLLDHVPEEALCPLKRHLLDRRRSFVRVLVADSQVRTFGLACLGVVIRVPGVVHHFACNQNFRQFTPFSGPGYPGEAPRRLPPPPSTAEKVSE